ncbi:MAG: hypothetical protein K8S00_09080 [Bacteroidales bacterium]|nr:hypothetical protein [Bacteroidales bacterium]
MKKELLKSVAILIILFGTYNYTASQDMFGIINSNYAGTNGISINPASMVNSKLCMDINIATINPSIQNNYLYFNNEDYNVPALFSKGFLTDSQRAKGDNKEDVMQISDDNNKRDKYLYNNITLQLPSIMLAYNKHAFALNTSIRTVFSIRNIADHAATFFYEGSDYKPQQGINYDFKDAEITQMAWSEISLSYAYLFSQNSHSQWSGGISLKYLLGHNAIFARGHHNNYMFIDDATLQVNNLDAEYGYSPPPVCPETNEFGKPDRLINGQGVGMNLGVIYQKNMKGNRNTNGNDFECNKHEDYLYKIGLSFIDIGAIRFNQNAQTFKFDNVSTYWEGFDTTEVKCFDHFNKNLSYKFYGDSLASQDSDEFSIALPAFVSLQFDYQFRPGFYLNTTIIQNLKVGKYSLGRPNLLSVTPRYETSWLEVSVPIIMYNYQLPCAGLAVRIYGVTIGTDKLCGFVGISDIYGLDFYCSIKIGFVNGTCGKKCQSSKISLLNFKKKNNRNRSSKARSFASR